MARKILVVGGARFFGKHLVSNLIRRGDQVTIATRGLTQDPFGDAVHRLIVDRENADALKKALNESYWDIVYDQICYSPNDARALLGALDGQVERLILTSTQSIYEKNGRQVEEDFNPYAYNIRTGGRTDFSYGEAKRLAEAVYFKQAECSTVAVRLPYVLGDDDYTGRLDFHIARVRLGKAFRFENPEALTSFVEAREAARFLEWLGDNDQVQGPINACSLGEISFSKLFKLIGEVARKEPLIEPISATAEVSPYSTAVSRYLDTSKAAKLGFKFSHWSEWLPNLIESLYSR